MSNGVEMPRIGLGTWQINNREVLMELIGEAYSLGYTMIDTAAAYGNERWVGRAAAALPAGREGIFLSDKVWNTCRGYEKVREACRASLKKLKTDHLDLYLVHWPASRKHCPDWKELNADTWRGMESLYREGLVRAIGVCNFTVPYLEELEKTAAVLPMVDQIEFHPGMLQRETTEYCIGKGICLEAASPLGNGRILGNGILGDIARRKGKSPAQVCLRYAVEKGFAVIPKTVDPRRLAENRDIFDFALTEAEREALDGIPYCGGVGIDPDEGIEAQQELPG